MRKSEKPKKEPKPQSRVPKQPKGVTELTEHDLEQVQGGSQNSGTNNLPYKM
jgi:mersacidin/lichenicidin family type 2 lantibiotic